RRAAEDGDALVQAAWITGVAATARRSRTGNSELRHGRDGRRTTADRDDIGSTLGVVDQRWRRRRLDGGVVLPGADNGDALRDRHLLDVRAGGKVDGVSRR